jgi:hypothetical protein
VKLGDNLRRILDTFGQPAENKLDGEKRKVVYIADYKTNPAVLYYQATFEFENDRLTSVTLYNGD